MRSSFKRTPRTDMKHLPRKPRKQRGFLRRQQRRQQTPETLPSLKIRIRCWDQTLTCIFRNIHVCVTSSSNSSWRFLLGFLGIGLCSLFCREPVDSLSTKFKSFSVMEDWFFGLPVLFLFCFIWSSFHEMSVAYAFEMVNFSLIIVLFLKVLFLNLVLCITNYVFQFHGYSKGLPDRFTWSVSTCPEQLPPKSYWLFSKQCSPLCQGKLLASFLPHPLPKKCWQSPPVPCRGSILGCNTVIIRSYRLKVCMRVCARACVCVHIFPSSVQGRGLVAAKEQY